MKQNRRARRRRVEYLFVTILFMSLVSLLLLYAYLFTKENNLPFTLDSLLHTEQRIIENEAIFDTNNQVIVTSDSDLQGRIGLISKLNPKRNEKGQITYQVTFSSKEASVTVSESELAIKETLYRIGASVEILDGTEDSKIVDGITEESGAYHYVLLDEQSNQLIELMETDLVNIIPVALDENNTAQQNNKILQETIEESKNYSMSVLEFPEGEFLLGSHNQDEDYILLASNIELRGNQTTFVIDGASRWLGLATGPTAYDGVSNVVMYGFQFKAADLANGNQFVVMLNHGANWKIYNNSFTMVHPKSSHIFDLGGVINFEFVDNQFIGYAPDMTGETVVGETETEKHHIYSEAIQLDVSSTAAWDGHTISRIDPNFKANNQDKVTTSYVTIARNQFLPYKNVEGEIVAYSATVGQHYQKVGPGIVIQHNTFVSQLPNNFNINFNKDTVFRPVHAESDYDIILSPNSVY